MLRQRVLRPCAALAVIVIATISLAGCGGPRNREAITFTQSDLASAAWVDKGYDAWDQHVDLDDSLPTFSDLGAYPVGNGRVFGAIGLALPFGTVQDMLGPTYQKAGALLGAWLPSVLVDGEPLSIARQSTRWIAPGGVVHSRWEGERIHVDLLQTAPLGVNAVVTLMMVTNMGDAPVDVSFGWQPNLPIDGQDDGDLLCSRGDVIVRAGFAGAQTSVVDRAVMPAYPESLSDRVRPISAMAADLATQSVVCPLGAVQPEESVGKIAYLAVGNAADETASIARVVEEQGWQLFEVTHAWWQEWHDRTLIIEGAGDEIDEFMAIQKYLCRVQQAEAGGYSPMHKYSYRWIRDSNGPIMFLLDCGDFESVDRDLSYHFAGCAKKRDIFNNIELNVELDLDNPEVIDWSDVATPKAEIASFIILQNWWYYQHTGETEQLEERWDYLVRAFDGHEVDEQGRLPFHGDETYRFPGYQLATTDLEAVADYVHLTLRSADSAFEYVVAAEAMAEMAGLIGRPDEEIARYRDAAKFVRDATERFYWQKDLGYYAPAMSAVSGELYRYPFANICLRPTWIGYAGADKQQARNVTSALRWLYRADAGTCNLTPTCGYTVGMTPGMVLSALAAIDHPEAAKALEGLLAAASPSAGYAEMNRPDDTPSRDVWGMHRVRPWEGGINGSAVLQYLTGFTVADGVVRFNPHLPHGSDTMTVHNLRIRDAVLTLTVRRAAEGLSAEVTCEDGAIPVQMRVGDSSGSSGEAAPALEAGESVTLEWPERRRRSEEPARLEVAEEPFDYGSADVRRGATVLLTWSAEVAEQVRAAEGEVTVIDPRIAWPASYVRSALLNVNGSPRATRLITDIEGWPGAFKPKDFWTEGEGAEVLAAYRAAGGVIEQASVAGAGGAPSEELIN